MKIYEYNDSVSNKNTCMFVLSRVFYINFYVNYN